MKHPKQCRTGSLGPTRPISGRAGRQDGFTLPEILLALAITAALLTSVAMAMQSAMSSYTENSEIADVAQAARVIFNHIASDLRTADNAAAPTSNLLTITPAPGGSISLIKYEFVGGQLFYRATSGGVETSSVLISSSEDLKVTGFTASVAAVSGKAQSATVTLGLTQGGNPLSVTSSACLRRNLNY
jgi:prepilin-type N-terminal cleavage/methylation domain-containing protein